MKTFFKILAFVLAFLPYLLNAAPVSIVGKYRCVMHESTDNKITYHSTLSIVSTEHPRIFQMTWVGDDNADATGILKNDVLAVIYKDKDTVASPFSHGVLLATISGNTLKSEMVYLSDTRIDTETCEKVK